ncbi:leucine-rich repeat protein, partial [bacterium]|nr:leucine-rich repeat protein [bacterium]
MITLVGDASVNQEAGTTYTDAGANVTDSFDGTLTVTTSGTVDVNTAGTYTLTYTATDAAGNAATAVTRTVDVVSSGIWNALQKITFDVSGATARVESCDNTASGVLEIPATYQGKAVTSIGGQAFHSCINLTSVVIPSSITSIGGNAFYNCTGLTSVTISNGVLDIAGGAFAFCTQLASITFPDSVAAIGDDVLDGCISLNSISVGSGNADFSAPGGVLHDKNQQTLIKYPEGISGSYAVPPTVVTVGQRSFSGSALETVVLPDSVTSVGNFAFLSAESLSTVRFGKNIASIGDLCFEGCSNLTGVYFEGDAPTSFGAGIFAGVSIDAKVYANDTATGFDSTFADLPVVRVDSTAPVILLQGDVSVNHEAGEDYEDDGATVTDNLDSNVKVITTGTVDVSTLGTYTLTFNATDAAGNEAVELKRTVVVVDTTAPVI